MADINKALEKEIVDLNGEIEKLLIDLRPDDMSESLRYLRHKVFNAHTEIDIDMEISIFLDLLYSAANPDDVGKKIATFLKKTDPILSSLGFTKKLNLYKSIKDPENKDSNLVKKISDLNDMRVSFAHPKKGRYKKYDDRSEYKKALEIIKLALEVVKAPTPLK